MIVRSEKVAPLPSAAIKTVTIAVRILLGAIFLFSSVGKIADPEAFHAVVINYRLLPPSLVTATAVIFPWIEALCGLALILGRYEKGAALLVSTMMIVFIGIGFYNGYRGLNIACGCFSLTAKAPSSIAVNTLRNMAILMAGAWVLILPGPQQTRQAQKTY